MAITLVLGAVFVPTAFVEGISGQFYKQFALTIAVSTILSGGCFAHAFPGVVRSFNKGAGRKAGYAYQDNKSAVW